MEKWTDRIDRVTVDFIESFQDLTQDEFNYKPTKDTWSIAQNIDHLMVINQSYFPLFEQLRNGSLLVSWVGKIGFMVSFMGKTILKSVQPDRRRKMRTFSIWEPTQIKLSKDILIQFKDHQQILKQEIESCSELVSESVVIVSPANKNVIYRLETAFDIMITHEFRHLEQAKEVLAVLKTA